MTGATLKGWIWMTFISTVTSPSTYSPLSTTKPKRWTATAHWGGHSGSRCQRRWGGGEVAQYVTYHEGGGGSDGGGVCSG